MRFSHFSIFFFLIIYSFNFVSSVSLDTSSSIVIDSGIRVLQNSFDGETTDLLYFNDTELEVIENLTIEDTKFGKILFLEKINLTKDAINNIIHLDNNILFSTNSIYINTTRLTSLNKPAQIIFYNIDFNDPEILKAGSSCQNCEIISYENGQLILNVLDFNAIYQIREKEISPEPPVDDTPAEGGSSGGGSGGGTTTPIEQTIEEDEPFAILTSSSISFIGHPGEEFNQTILLKNNQETELILESSLDGLKGYGVFENEILTLKPGEIKPFILKFDIPVYAVEEMLIGTIKIKDSQSNLDATITIVLNIQEEDAPFNIELEIPTREITDFDELITIIKIIDALKASQELEGKFTRSLLDNEGNILFSDEEGISFLGDITLERGLNLPESLEDGEYYFYVEFISNGKKSMMVEKIILKRDSRFKFFYILYDSFIKYNLLNIILGIILFLVSFKLFSRILKKFG